MGVEVGVKEIRTWGYCCWCASGLICKWSKEVKFLPLVVNCHGSVGYKSGHLGWWKVDPYSITKQDLNHIYMHHDSWHEYTCNARVVEVVVLKSGLIELQHAMHYACTWFKIDAEQIACKRNVHSMQ